MATVVGQVSNGSSVEVELVWGEGERGGKFVCRYDQGTLDLMAGDYVHFHIINDDLIGNALTYRAWVSFDLIERQAGWRTVYKQS